MIPQLPQESFQNHPGYNNNNKKKKNDDDDNDHLCNICADGGKACCLTICCTPFLPAAMSARKLGWYSQSTPLLVCWSLWLCLWVLRFLLGSSNVVFQHVMQFALGILGVGSFMTIITLAQLRGNMILLRRHGQRDQQRMIPNDDNEDDNNDEESMVGEDACCMHEDICVVSCLVASFCTTCLAAQVWRWSMKDATYYDRIRGEEMTATAGMVELDTPVNGEGIV